MHNFPVELGPDPVPRRLGGTQWNPTELITRGLSTAQFRPPCGKQATPLAPLPEGEGDRITLIP
jgi:hypothetical protein